MWENDLEMKEMKEKMKELIGLLHQSEIKRKEAEKELKIREQTAAIALATSDSVGLSHILLYSWPIILAVKFPSPFHGMLRWGC